MKTESAHKRHLAKAVTWRVVGTIDTIIVSWIISGNPFLGIKIGIFEAISKMILYYFHEKLWFKSTVKKANQRHLFKTITWRLIGTLDTVLIAWMVSGNAFIGIKIGALEMVSKMILYYLHEKIWYKYNFGLSRRNSK